MSQPCFSCSSDNQNLSPHGHGQQKIADSGSKSMSSISISSQTLILLMEFDLQQFDLISRDAFAELPNRKLYQVHEKRNHSKVFTLCIVEGAEDPSVVKKHTHLASITNGVLKVKGHKIIVSNDPFGLPLTRQAYLLEEVDQTLYQLVARGQIQAETMKNLLSDIIAALAELQQEEVAIPYLMPQQIVRTKEGQFKLLDVSHAVNVLGMDSSLPREIKSDIHYMDPDTFLAAVQGQTFAIQNYFKSVIYSLGLIILEVISCSFQQHRESPEQIEAMLEKLHRKCGEQFASLVRQMVDASRSARPDSVQIYRLLSELKLEYMAQDSINWVLPQFTTSQMLGQTEENKEFQVELEYSSQFNSLKNSSGIRLPDFLKDQVKLWQQQKLVTQEEEGGQLEKIDEFQDLESSDQIMRSNLEESMSFQTLFGVISQFKFIPLLHLQDLKIDYDYCIDNNQKVYRCKVRNDERIVKISRSIPYSSLIQLLVNMMHIQKFKIEGICKYQGYCVEDCQDLGQVNLYLIMNQLSCDLERAVTQKMLRTRDKARIALQLAHTLNELIKFEVHGSLKPSNILLCNDINVYVVDYGLTEFIEGTGSSLLVTNPYCSYAPPEKRLENQLTTQSDIWSFGLILFYLFTGHRVDDKLLHSNHMLDKNRKGALDCEIQEYPKLAGLIKRMTKFEPERRLTSSQVLEELKVIFSVPVPQHPPQSAHAKAQNPFQFQQPQPGIVATVKKQPSKYKLVEQNNQHYSARHHNVKNNLKAQNQTQPGGFYIQGNSISLQQSNTPLMNLRKRDQ